jgi:hypothetical protein
MALSLPLAIAVLNKTLGGSFKRLYPDFPIDNDNHGAQQAA